MSVVRPLCYSMIMTNYLLLEVDRIMATMTMKLLRFACETSYLALISSYTVIHIAVKNMRELFDGHYYCMDENMATFWGLPNS